MQFSTKKCKLVIMEKIALLGATKLVKAVIDAYYNHIICMFLLVKFALLTYKFAMKSVNLCIYMELCLDVFSDTFKLHSLFLGNILSKKVWLICHCFWSIITCMCLCILPTMHAIMMYQVHKCIHELYRKSPCSFESILQ